MSALIPLIYVHFLIFAGPALVIGVAVIRNIRRENYHDRRALAEMKLARLHGIAHPEETRLAA
jgi:hypothetical protein